MNHIKELFWSLNVKPDGCLRSSDASSVTAIRTRAVSAVATKALAKKDASDLTIFGSGTQASMHLEAMSTVRPIKRVRVWSRNPEHAEEFARRESSRGRSVEAFRSAQDAIAGCDIVCTTTASTSPILKGKWLEPGVHINAIGASVSPFQLDSEAVVRSTLFVDRRESTLNESEDFLVPKKEGLIGDDHIKGELGEVLLGRVKGRVSDDEITLFKSVGLAVEDLASALPRIQKG